MTFQQLTYVVEISKCGSINKAAHKLFLSQSGISTAVRELEEELGIKFFVRSNRGVEFTPEGKEFLGYAVSLLEQKQRIESLYGESRSTIAPVHFSVSTQRYPFTEDAFLEMLQQNQENRYQYTLKETSMDGVIDDVYDHRADIGVCIVATVSADTVVPAAACLLQRALGLPEDTPCFDLNAACTGFVYALHTMECLLNASPRKFGLVVGAEALSKVVDWTDRGTCILFGDGAAAAVVECREGWPSIGAVLGSRGDDVLLRLPGLGRGEPNVLSMEGTQVFKFAVETVPACMDATLKKAGLTPADIDFFVFHQANARIIDLAVRKYRIPPEKYYKNIDRYGNTAAASVPLVLSELVEQGRVGPGSRLLLTAFGGGLTWGGAVLEMA